MKLLFCTKCQDVFKLSKQWRSCTCGTAGKYLDNINAVYEGTHAIPIGFSNQSLGYAILDQTKTASVPFDAFVIETECPTFVRKGRKL